VSHLLNNNSTCQPGLNLLAPAARNVFHVVGDVNDLSVLKKIVDTAVQKFGRIDILVFIIYYLFCVIIDKQCRYGTQRVDTVWHVGTV
jgi:hypothetical protein